MTLLTAPAPLAQEPRRLHPAVVRTLLPETVRHFNSVMLVDPHGHCTPIPQPLWYFALVLDALGVGLFPAGSSRTSSTILWLDEHGHEVVQQLDSRAYLAYYGGPSAPSYTLEFFGLNLEGELQRWHAALAHLSVESTELASDHPYTLQVNW